MIILAMAVRIIRVEFILKALTSPFSEKLRFYTVIILFYKIIQLVFKLNL